MNLSSENFTLPHPALLSTLKLELTTSTFSFTGYSVTPNRLASFHSDVTNTDLAPETSLTLFLFPPPSYFIPKLHS